MLHKGLKNKFIVQQETHWIRNFVCFNLELYVVQRLCNNQLYDGGAALGDRVSFNDEKRGHPIGRPLEKRAVYET